MPWQGQYLQLFAKLHKIRVSGHESCASSYRKVGRKTIGVAQLINKFQSGGPTCLLFGYIDRFNIVCKGS